MNKKLTFGLAIAVLAATVGCTRKVDNNSGAITLSFDNSKSVKRAINHAKNSAGVAGTTTTTTAGSDAATTPQIQIIVISISASDMPTMVTQWPPNGSGNGSNGPAPDSITIKDVPTGSNRLVQVLEILNTDGGSEFDYDDATTSVPSSDGVTVTPAKIGTGASVNDNIVGRYLNASGAGPTGTLSVYFAPPGKPIMLVDQSQEIFAGWFKTFAIEGAQLRYIASDGTDLFGAPIGATDGSLLGSGADSPRVVRAYSPGSYNQQGGMGSTTYQYNSPSHIVVGWFGPGSIAKGKRVCYYSGTQAINQAYTDATGSTLESWVGLLTTPTDAQKTVSAYVEVGGDGVTTLDPTNTFCEDTGTRFVDYISLVGEYINQHDSTVGFRGPFQQQFSGNGGSQTMQITPQTNGFTAAWSFLPGVVATVTGKGMLEGLDFFARVEAMGGNTNNGGNADYSTGNDDGVNCSGLTTLANPFTFLQSATNFDATQTNFTANVQNLPAALTTAVAQGNVTVIACPYTTTPTGKRYFTSAAVQYPNGGSSGPVNATSIVLQAPQSAAPFNVIQGVCTPLSVNGMSGSAMAQIPAATMLTFSTDAGLALYSDPGCTIALAVGTPVAPMGGWNYQFYVSASDSSVHTLSVTTTALGNASITINSLAAPGTPNPTMLVSGPPSLIYAYSCYPLNLSAWNNYGTSSAGLYPFSAGPSFMFPTGTYQYWSNGNCTGGGAANPFYFTTNSTQIYGSFMYTGTAPSIYFTATPTGFSGATVGIGTVHVNQPGAVANFQTQGIGNSIQEGQLQQVTVSLVDAQNHPSPATSTVTIDQISASSGGVNFLMYGAGCYPGTTVALPLTIPIGQTSATFCVQATTPGASFNLTIKSNSNNISMTTPSISVMPAVASQIIDVFATQTWTPGSTPPTTPPPLIPGQSFAVTLYAIKYNNMIDTNFNLTVPIQTANGLMSVPSNVTFVGGQATLNLTTASNMNSFNMGFTSNFMYSGSNLFMSLNAYVEPVQLSTYMGATSFVNNACQPVMVVAEMQNGSGMVSVPPALLPAFSAATVTIGVPAGATAYSDSSCTTPITSFGFGASAAKVFFVKGSSGTSGGINISSANYAFSTTTPINIGLTSGTPSPGSAWTMIGRTSVAGGSCDAYLIYVADASGNFSPPSVNFTDVLFTPENEGGTVDYLYSDASCSSEITRTTTTFNTSPGYELVYGRINMGTTQVVLGTLGSEIPNANSPTLTGF